MKLMFLPLTLFAAIALAPADTLRDHIVATDRAVDQALLKGDMTKFAALEHAEVTPDFKHVENGRAISFDEMVKHMKAGLAMFKTMTEAKSTLLSLKATGDHATAQTNHVMSGVTAAGPDHKTHQFTFSGVTTDAYRKEGGKWKLASMTWTAQKGFMDGKPLPSR